MRGKNDLQGIAILGSCVSRDAVEFVSDLPVKLYCARQSIASLVSQPPAPDLASSLKLAQGMADFHTRCIEEDIGKTALSKMAALPTSIPIMIDLIEERAPLGRTEDGAIVTLSEVATNLTNLRELVADEIAPWSDDHIDLLSASIPNLARALDGHTVLIHRAFFADHRRSFPEVNGPLTMLYDKLAGALPKALMLEAPADVRLHEPRHKWKAGPYHYIDAYYHEIVRQMQKVLATPMKLKPGHSLRIPETT